MEEEKERERKEGSSSIAREESRGEGGGYTVLPDAHTDIVSAEILNC